MPHNKIPAPKHLTQNTTIQPVILAGGSGTRLWPLSRASYPKQFLRLLDPDYSLFQQTVLRCQAVSTCPPLVICHQEHRFLVAEQLRAIDTQAAAILLEPIAKNTAPAILLAALWAEQNQITQPLLIVSSDHVLKPDSVFAEAVQQALPFALDQEQNDHEQKIVTFGVTPDHPETGYGYIQRGKPCLLNPLTTLSKNISENFSENTAEKNQTSEPTCYTIERFVEKPDHATAEQYVKSGAYDWNSGMFLFTAGLCIAEFQRFAPDIERSVTQAFQQATRDLDFIRIDPSAWDSCRAESFDYAIMEHTEHAVMVRLAATWSDVGSWASVHSESTQDTRGNSIQGDVWLDEVDTCLVRAESRLVVALGIRDLVVIETADTVLIAHQDQSQALKNMVARLSTANRTEVQQNRRVYRPWGWYESICEGDRFQTKRLFVAPKQRLSLQLHHHRAEHWVVVRGTAIVKRGVRDHTTGEVSYSELVLSENQSTYIPLGVQHSLENPGVIPLEIIEVQSGSYLGEDDIVRFEDRYGRC